MPGPAWLGRKRLRDAVKAAKEVVEVMIPCYLLRGLVWSIEI